MTVLYFHGWNTSFETKENIDFYSNLCRLSKNKTILLIPFAQNKNNWNKSILEEKISKFCNNWVYKIKVASTNKYILIFQIIVSKIIFIPGWDYCNLMNYLWFLKYFKFVFYSKTIFGISAWANIFGKFSYSDDYFKVFPWIWLINSLLKSHFDDFKDQEKIKKLQNFANDLKIIKLKEKQYIKLEI